MIWGEEMQGRIGLICAGDRELAPFLPHIKTERIARHALLNVQEGSIERLNVCALFSGVGKVNAAIAAQILIDRFGVSMIVNTGTAGGVSGDVHLFDTVVATEAVHYDVEDHILTGFHPWLKEAVFPSDQRLLHFAQAAAARAGGRVLFGRMATGETFVADDTRGEVLQRSHPLTADMETAAIAQVCHANGIPFIAVRTVTDDAMHSGCEFFEENCARAAEMAKDFVLLMLHEIRNESK